MVELAKVLKSEEKCVGLRLNLSQNMLIQVDLRIAAVLHFQRTLGEHSFRSAICVDWSWALKYQTRTCSNNAHCVQRQTERNTNCSDLRPDNGHHSHGHHSDPRALRKAVGALWCVTMCGNCKEWRFVPSMLITFYRPGLTHKSLCSGMGRQHNSTSNI